MVNPSERHDTDTANDALMSDDVMQHFVKIQGSYHSAAANIQWKPVLILFSQYIL